MKRRLIGPSLTLFFALNASAVTYRFAVQAMNSLLDKPETYSILEGALNMVKFGDSYGIGIESSSASIENLDFVIQISTGADLRDLLASLAFRGAIITPDLDAFTYVDARYMKGPFFVTLIWDRLTTIPKRIPPKERHDAFTRVALALAHEIYGNVRSLVARRENMLAHTRLLQAEDEVRAFQAGVDFARKMLEKAGPQFPPKIRNNLKENLGRELHGLQTWIRRRAELRLRENLGACGGPLE